jgi:hypothetical protein
VFRSHISPHPRAEHAATGTARNAATGTARHTAAGVAALALAAASMAVASLAVGSPASAARPAVTPWNTAASPANLSTFDRVSAAADGTVMAIGQSTTLYGDLYGPQVDRWTGTGWQTMSLPSSVTMAPESISVASARDAWIVGMVNPAGAAPTAHWNGSAWTPVAVPSGVTTLTGVLDFGSTNAWAVGWETVPTYHPDLLHWNGSAWSSVAVPDAPGSPYTSLRQIAGSGPDDIWVTGSSENSVAYDALHYNGVSWTPVATPTDSRLTIGDVGGQAWLTKEGLTAGFYRWNGSGWTSVPAPAPVPHGAPLFTGIDGAATNDVWAVGVLEAQGTSHPSVTYHWDGTAWSQVASPNGQFGNVAAVPGGSLVVAVGIDLSTPAGTGLTAWRN